MGYSGHMLVRTSPTTQEQGAALAQLRESGVDFWTEPIVGRNVDIRVPPHQAEQLLDAAPMVKGVMRNGHSMDWTSYHPLDDMYSYLDYLEATYDFVTTESIGKSYNGQDMRIIKVCRGGCGNKPALWFDGGIHAREWVSPAVTTYMAMELLENDSAHPDLTQNTDWYILPVMNPDGYLYTQSNDRMWRKTRSPNSGSCPGTDANRNWGYHWNTGGSSNNPCSDTYHGKSAFSEIENVNVRDFLTNHKDTIKYYMNIHSYSQLILLPWGFSYDKPANYNDLFSLATAGNQALKAAHGKNYDIGCIPCLLYVASGGSLDWTLGVAGIPYSYGIELRDTGNYGFILPPSQIIPNGEEVWAFHEVVGRQIAKEFGKEFGLQTE